MKKLIALIVAALLALSAVAFAETYHTGDVTFDYDEQVFEISLVDSTDDVTNVVVYGKAEAWGHTYVSFYMEDLQNGKQFPTAEELSKENGVEVTEGEWNGYKNVLMYAIEGDDGMTRSTFIVPVMDDNDNEVDDILTVGIGTSKIDDEATLQARDDAISAIVDSLKVKD